MKPFKIKKRKIPNQNIKVVVLSEDTPQTDKVAIQKLPQPHLPLKLITKITKPYFKGHVEFVYEH